jgi:hypothetical protein
MNARSYSSTPPWRLHGAVLSKHPYSFVIAVTVTTGRLHFIFCMFKLRNCSSDFDEILLGPTTEPWRLNWRFLERYNSVTQNMDLFKVYNFCFKYIPRWFIFEESNEGIGKVFLCFNWAPRNEGVLGEWRYISTHLLTWALGGGERSSSRSGRFSPRKRAPGNHWIEGWVGTREYEENRQQMNIGTNVVWKSQWSSPPPPQFGVCERVLINFVVMVFVTLYGHRIVPESWYMGQNSSVNVPPNNTNFTFVHPVHTNEKLTTELWLHYMPLRRCTIPRHCDKSVASSEE